MTVDWRRGVQLATTIWTSRHGKRRILHPHPPAMSKAMSELTGVRLSLLRLLPLLPVIGGGIDGSVRGGAPAALGGDASRSRVLQPKATGLSAAELNALDKGRETVNHS